MQNSATKITEKYEFLTDVITSYNGAEQRLKLRQYPRHYLTYDYSAMDSYQAQYLRGMARMRQTDAYYIPMWHNVSYLKEDVVAGDNVLKIDSEYLYNFDDVEYIYIYVEDVVVGESRNITKKVYDYTSTEIQVNGIFKRDLHKENTFIYPLRKCILQPTLSIDYVYSNGTEIALGFEDLNIKSNVQIPYTFKYEYEEIGDQYNRWNFPSSYNGIEIFNLEPRWKEDSDVQLQIEKNIIRMDNDTGIFMYDLKSSNSYDLHSYSFVLDSQSKINNMIKFFKRVGGRYKSFYMPTWANDFNVTRDIESGDDSIYTDFTELYKFYISNGKKKHIIIFTKDWKSYIYPIMAYSYTLDEETNLPKYGRLVLQEPIETKLKVDNILMCSYLNLVRLDDDSLILDYESNKVAMITLIMKELDR